MSGILDFDPLARHHTEKDGAAAEEVGNGMDTRLSLFPAVTFYSTPLQSRTLPTHSIICIDVDMTDAREERIIITHHMGVLQVIGTGLAAIAARLRKFHIGEVHTGKQAEGGTVERIV